MLIGLFCVVWVAGAYDPTLSKHCIDLAQSSYCVSSPTQWDCTTCDSSIQLEYVTEIEGVRAIQGYDNFTQTLFVAFRGSENIQNWIDNVQVEKVYPYNDTTIGIEKGFHKAYHYVENDLLRNLEKLTTTYKTHDVLVTGHSMGSALATLLAYDLMTSDTYTVSHLITFGSPRVGNTAFVKSFNTYPLVYSRVTHYNDIVPHVPEELLGFLHVSNEIWYNEDNSEFSVCDDYNTEDDMCSNSCSPTHCTSTSDHLYYLNVTMGEDGCMLENLQLSYPLKHTQ